MSNKVKSSVKIRNWAKYNESLVNHSDITFWFSDKFEKEWKHKTMIFTKADYFLMACDY